MGSETVRFPTIVEEVRKADAEKAEILEKGFADLSNARGGALAARAKALLENLD